MGHEVQLTSEGRFVLFENLSILLLVRDCLKNTVSYFFEMPPVSHFCFWPTFVSPVGSLREAVLNPETCEGVSHFLFPSGSFDSDFAGALQCRPVLG